MATLLCGCGHKLWSEFWWTGSEHLWMFFDDERSSGTYAAQVTSCPECGEQVTHNRRVAIGQNFGTSRPIKPQQ